MVKTILKLVGYGRIKQTNAYSDSDMLEVWSHQEEDRYKYELGED